MILRSRSKNKNMLCIIKTSEKIIHKRIITRGRPLSSFIYSPCIKVLVEYVKCAMFLFCRVSLTGY